MAITDEREETSRYLMASNLTWRTLEMVQGHPLRWLVEVFVQDWKSPAGWSPLPQQPGAEGARHRVSLSLLVDHGRFFPPDPLVPLRNHLPAYTVGSRRAHGPVECLVNVIETLVSSAAPQAQLPRFTHA